MRKRPWVVVGLALVAILATSLLAQSFYLENRKQRQENLYREAQINRLSLAQQPAPELGAGLSLRPAAEQALRLCAPRPRSAPRAAFTMKPSTWCLLNIEAASASTRSRGGKAELPRAWVGDQEFPWPFALIRDAKLLQVPGFLLHLDTGITSRTEGPPSIQSSL